MTPDQPAVDERGHRDKHFRAMMKIWYTLTMKLKMEDPTPLDLPQYRSGENAHRILLFGNGPTHGWGVFSHRFALTGQLGLSMQDNHQKRVNIDYVGDELMNTKTAADWLRDVQLDQYDQVIFCLSWSDAVRLTPLDDWQNDYTNLIDNAKQRMRPTASLVLVGIEPVESSAGYMRVGGRIAKTHADLMNEKLMTFAAAENTAYAPIGARTSTPDRPLGSPYTYRIWADQITEIAAPLLSDETPEVDLPAGPVFNWIGSPYVLGFAPGNFPNFIQEIEIEAKKELGADLAQITIMEQNRQWMATHSGPAPQSVPRHLTYCDIAVAQDEPLVIPNAKTDPRFKDNEYLKMSAMPFYAGTALRSRSGEVVGSFCVLGIAPRPKQFFNMNKYKVLLGKAQAEIWRIEDEALARSIAYEI